MDNILEDLIENSPQEIAEKIFNDQPKSPRTYQIISAQDINDVSIIFEILITIFLEGFKILVGSFKNIDLSNFTSDHIKQLDPWFASLGFKINVKEYCRDDYDKYSNYYCKIILNNDEWGPFFQLKNINKDYHFLINQLYFKGNNFSKLEDMFSVFYE